MEPRLIVISGVMKGTTLPLTGSEVSIGRETSNDICLNDPSISRRHCLLKKNETDAAVEFKVKDLESYNGTFVNGLPVQEQPLAHGDQIALGDVHFLFLVHELHPTVPAIQFAEGDLITRSTVRLQREEAFYLRPDKVLAEVGPNDRIAHELNTLLKISNSINSIRQSSELQQRLVELILEVVPAERGAILLFEERQERFVSVCGWNRLSGRDDSIKVSKTIANQVLRDVVALLSNDIFENEIIGGTPSLVTSRVCSVLCVPLAVFDKAFGVIYLDTSDPSARFDEGISNC
jgi:pSer/pThr/pTyr-binding forkhead associated (FHA) protein